MQRKLHRLLYFIGMREELAKTLLSLPHGDNDRLPSVRTLMNTYRVSSGTVQAALASLSEVDGRTVSGEIVNEIFSHFCVGK